ncbi:MAG: EVE domain-containing protein [Deltaproteobacteria bacterium CG11_big_fil_rev_8_21_14_0_20_47_16]|nr:MAG: EVE domain-containing protein [Deltaproteobacteria bacterium CG11_big_fil_rev_8_21_14_0_20_47_16]
MRYWLMKSEPGCYSIDDLKRDKKTAWTGVRNYQARNFMRDDMKVGDMVLFYHSNSDPAGVAGVAKVCATAHEDETAWDHNDDHYDPKSTPANPIWVNVDIAFVEKLPQFVSLPEMKAEPELRGMMVLQKGSRLSIQPVTAPQFKWVLRMGGI